MKQIKMNSFKLQALFDSLKESIARDDSRPILKYIKVEVKGEVLTAVSVDGYMLSTFKTQIINEGEEDFEFVIQPFYIPKTKLGCEVVFNCDTENIVKVNVTDQLTKNKIEYEFNNGSMLPENFIDWQKFLIPTDKNLKVYMDAGLLMRILKQFTKNHGVYNNKIEISFEREGDGINPLKPVNIKQNTEIGIMKEAIVLPIKQINE